MGISNEHLLQNLQDIIQLKKENPGDIVLLLGNHDLHYFDSKIEKGTRYDFDLAPDAKALFLNNRKLFQYAYQKDFCIFTHAGISHKWFTEDFKGDMHQNIAEQLNNPKQEQIESLYKYGFFRGGDIDAVGGIFWADARELYQPLQGYTQIVGHNRVKDIVDHTKNGGRIIFCDCLFNEHYLKI